MCWMKIGPPTEFH